MCRKIACNRNEVVPALVAVPPCRELPATRLQHLIGVEACILAQHRTRERGDQRLRRRAEREMACHQPCREIDLPLSVESVEQGDTDRLRIGGQNIERLPPPPPGARPRAPVVGGEKERPRPL